MMDRYRQIKGQKIFRITQTDRKKDKQIEIYIEDINKIINCKFNSLCLEKDGAGVEVGCMVSQ